jgi:DNA-binding NarL/FixJ family response regulator
MNYMGRSNYQEDLRERKKGAIVKEYRPLTERQMTIINGLKDGKTQAQIAEEVFTCPGHVVVMIRKICERFDCSNKVQLIYKLAKEGVI